jgi:hypothetical protein
LHGKRATKTQRQKDAQRIFFAEAVKRCLKDISGCSSEKLKKKEAAPPPKVA